MLPGVLLDMVATPGNVDSALHRCSRRDRLRREMQNPAMLFICHFTDRNLTAAIQHQLASIVHLAAAGRVKRVRSSTTP